MLVKLLRRIVARLGYDVTVTRRPGGLDQRGRTRAALSNQNTARTFLDGALEALLAMTPSRPLSIVQVGANDGVTNDPLFRFVSVHPDTTSIVLIEPQPDVVEILGENYASHPHATMVNCAIGPESPLVLYRIKPEYQRHYKGIIGSGVTSVNRDHVLGKAERLLPKFRGKTPEDLIESCEVECCVLADVLNRHEVSVVDVLQVDVEGFDDQVIYASNIGELLPRLINYETSLFAEQQHEVLGRYLDSLGYRRIQWSDEDECALLES